MRLSSTSKPIFSRWNRFLSDDGRDFHLAPLTLVARLHFTTAHSACAIARCSNVGDLIDSLRFWLDSLGFRRAWPNSRRRYLRRTDPARAGEPI
jgi:hypothetical protein